jgi:PAS domain S-box-containing protein
LHIEHDDRERARAVPAVSGPSDSLTTPDGADFLTGGGDMERRIRAFDWTRTPLGPLEVWPQSLKTALKIALNSRYPIWMGWGWDLINLYNDPYIPVLGKRDEWALGASAREVWKEVWEAHLGPQADAVLLRGEASWNDQRQMVMSRNGYAEETYFTFSFSPLPADGGGVGGLFCACTEDTQKVLGERRLATLRHLAAATADARAEHDAATVAAQVLAEHGGDVAFALIYLIDAHGDEARLAAATPYIGEAHRAPAVIPLAAGGEDGHSWPLARAREQGMQILRGLDHARALPGGVWPEPASTVAVVPLAKAGHAQGRRFLVAGASPRLPFDNNYESFFELLARSVADALSNARAYEEERQRAEALAELDRAKTTFFSNVSHEFRTPLTLMLAPVEDMLDTADAQLGPAVREHLEVVHRNSLRLLRLVNTMLDFSRIEAGRITARYEPVDLPAYTAELASNFRSACERAGLRLCIHCPPLQTSEPVFADRDMWEKIVLNLVSNAFKFTLDGEIEVRVETVNPGAACLVVRDTGVGIPESELPRMFERFHRVDNARGRTHEGTGIGLALVHELVKLHGGTVGVQSVLGEGSSFCVTIPLGNTHLDRDRVQPAGTTVGRSSAYAFVEEALRWLSTSAPRDEQMLSPPLPGIDRDLALIPPPGERPRVLWADDNADMRDYVARLLHERYDVEAVTNGQAALDAARRRSPDLVLTDVMMPKLDGFGLLRSLRSDPALCEVPVVMLSARAGEESRIEGVEAGADDYLIKPFSARELVARVDAHLRLARLRRETERVRRESREQVERANQELTWRIAELERANAEIHDARTTALTLMDDALKANEALQHQSRRFQTLLNNAPLGVYLVDGDFRICEVNPLAAPVFGDIPGGVVGRDFDEIMHVLWEKHYADEIVRIFRHTLETGEPYITAERSEYRADRKTTEHYEWRLDRIVLPDGRHGLVCYFRDISQQVSARRALQ